MNTRKEMFSLRRNECISYIDFEEKYGINISNPIALSDDEIGGYRPTTISNESKFYGSNGYMGSFVFELDIINSFLKNNIDNLSRYTFIDIGSGKGKVNIYNEISDMRYRKNIGIEVDKDFYNISMENKKKFPTICFENKNALEIKILNEPTIYFFFQPFKYEIYKKFFEKYENEILLNDSLIINIFPYDESDSFYPDFDNDLFYKFKKIFEYEYISIYSS